MKITENTQSLKRSNDFIRIYRRGKSEAGGYIAVYALKNRSKTENRLGLTVGKSVGNAVVRSRMRRLLRECYRSYADILPSGWDFVFVARNRAAGQSLDRLKKDLGYALKKLALTEK